MVRFLFCILFCWVSWLLVDEPELLAILTPCLFVALAISKFLLCPSRFSFSSASSSTTSSTSSLFSSISSSVISSSSAYCVVSSTDYSLNSSSNISSINSNSAKCVSSSCVIMSIIVGRSSNSSIWK